MSVFALFAAGYWHVAVEFVVELSPNHNLFFDDIPDTADPEHLMTLIASLNMLSAILIFSYCESHGVAPSSISIVAFPAVPGVDDDI